MIISIDASRSVSTIQKTGVEKVSDELIKEILSLVETRQRSLSSEQTSLVSTDTEIIFYTPQEISWLPKENQKVLHWPFKFFWTQIRLTWELLIHPPQIMFFPAHAMPLLLFFTHYSLLITRHYKVIHDIAFKKQPQLYSFKQKMILNLDLWLAKKLCTKIFVPTQAVKDDILSFYHSNVVSSLLTGDIMHSRSSQPVCRRGRETGANQSRRDPKEKIVIAPWGYNRKNFQFPILNQVQDRFSNFSPYGGSPAGRQTNSKYQIPNPKINENNYGLRKKQILYIGRIEEKKNIGNLIKGFEIFHKKNPDYKLILAGKISPHYSLLITHYKNIEFLGYISEEKKHQLLSESAALAHVPKEEGFGFPILEAFDFGLPVVASDIPVLREIGANACVYVNPDLPESIARGLEIAVETHCNASLQEKIEKGHEHLKEFSWQKTAKKILTEIINFG